MGVKSDTDIATGRKPGMLTTIFRVTWRIIGILLFAAFISVLIEWIQMIFVHPVGTGYENAQNMMQKEMEYLTGTTNDGFSENPFMVGVSDSVAKTINFMFVDTGILAWVQTYENPKMSGNIVRDFVRGVMSDGYYFFVAAIYILATFVIRLGVLVLSMPAFALFGLVGLADGLTQRDIRRWSAGTESGFIYHWAKRFVMPMLYLSWVVYLSIPYSIHPNYVITPFAAMYGVVVMVMSSKFKKYL